MDFILEEEEEEEELIKMGVKRRKLETVSQCPVIVIIS